LGTKQHIGKGEGGGGGEKEKKGRGDESRQEVERRNEG